MMLESGKGCQDQGQDNMIRDVMPGLDVLDVLRLCIRPPGCQDDIRSFRKADKNVKGTVPQDFLLQVFFMNQLPPSP